MEMIVVLHNIRSCLNVGAILRTAEGLGVERAIFSGYTPRYDDTRELPHLREKLDKQIEKTALGAERYLELEDCEDIVARLEELKGEDYVIVGLENNLDDERKVLAKYDNLEKVREKLGKKIVLILGEEVAGIPRELYEEIDVFLEIPMRGKKESFNVAVAAGMAGFYLSVL